MPTAWSQVGTDQSWSCVLTKWFGGWCPWGGSVCPGGQGGQQPYCSWWPQSPRASPCSPFPLFSRGVFMSVHTTHIIHTTPHLPPHLTPHIHTYTTHHTRLPLPDITHTTCSVPTVSYYKKPCCRPLPLSWGHPGPITQQEGRAGLSPVLRTRSLLVTGGKG